MSGDGVDIDRIVREAVAAERERIAAWHDKQADLVEAAIAKILSEGGTVEISNRTLAELHRSFAAAIRGGAQ